MCAHFFLALLSVRQSEPRPLPRLSAESSLTSVSASVAAVPLCSRGFVHVRNRRRVANSEVRTPSREASCAVVRSLRR